MKRIRGGSGLGDSIYLRPVVDHFISSGEQVVAISNFSDVFIGSGAAVEPFRRDNVDVVAHYTSGKANVATTQWQDVCANARISAPLHFDWVVRNATMVDDLRCQADGRRIVMVHGGREPMGRNDGFGRELLPEQCAFEAVLSALDGCMLVQIGKGDQSYRLQAHVDLTGKTSVADMIDIASICDGVVTQCSFAVPLAECFDKPLLVVWSVRGLESRTPYIKQITPTKILSKRTSQFVMDDWPAEKIQEAVRAFRQL